MTTPPVPGWSHEYPWGRKHPKKRIEELEDKKREILRREKLLRDRFEERLIDFRRQMDLLDANIRIAEQCESDRVRRMTKQLAYRLFELGVDVLGRVEKATEEEGEALYKELLTLYREQREKAERRLGQEEPDGILPSDGVLEEDDGFVDPDLVDETLVTEEDIMKELPKEE